MSITSLIRKIEIDQATIDIQSKTGSFVVASDSGNFYLSSNPSGFISSGSDAELNSLFIKEVSTLSLSGADLVITSGNQYIDGDIIIKGRSVAGSGLSDTYYLSSNPSGFATNTKVDMISGNLITNYVHKSQTGSFITSGQTGQFYPSNNPNNYTTNARLAALSGELVSNYVQKSQTGIFITNSQAELFVLSTQTGQLVLKSQTGSFYPNTNPSGYALSGSVINLSGLLVDNYVLKNQTGSFITSAQTGAFVDRAQTGLFVIQTQTGSFVTSAQTGSFITNNGSVRRFISLSQSEFNLISSPSQDTAYIITGVGSTVYNVNNNSTDFSQFITDSETGIFYTTNNPSGFITTRDLDPFLLKSSTSLLVEKTQTGSFVTNDGSVIRLESLSRNEFNSLLSPSSSTIYIITGEGDPTINNSTQLSTPIGLQTGIYYSTTNPSGYISSSQTGVFYPRSNPSGFILPSQTGAFYSINNPSNYISSLQTGAFYPRSNPSGFITGINLNGYLSKLETGNLVTSDKTGIFYTINNPSGFVTKLETGIFYTANNPSGFIRSAETGLFYPANNPRGFITGIDLSAYTLKSQTGEFVTVDQVQIFYPRSNPSGFISRSETGNFLSANNAQNFVSTGQLVDYVKKIQTGSFVTTLQTGNFYPISNPSKFLTESQVLNYILTSGSAISGVLNNAFSILSGTYSSGLGNICDAAQNCVQDILNIDVISNLSGIEQLATQTCNSKLATAIDTRISQHISKMLTNLNEPQAIDSCRYPNLELTINDFREFFTTLSDKILLPTEDLSGLASAIEYKISNYIAYVIERLIQKITDANSVLDSAGFPDISRVAAIEDLAIRLKQSAYYSVVDFFQNGLVMPNQEIEELSSQIKNFLYQFTKDGVILEIKDEKYLLEDQLGTLVGKIPSARLSMTPDYGLTFQASASGGGSTIGGAGGNASGDVNITASTSQFSVNLQGGASLLGNDVSGGADLTIDKDSFNLNINSANADISGNVGGGPAVGNASASIQDGNLSIDASIAEGFKLNMGGSVNGDTAIGGILGSSGASASVAGNLQVIASIDRGISITGGGSATADGNTDGQSNADSISGDFEFSIKQTGDLKFSANTSGVESCNGQGGITFDISPCSKSLSLNADGQTESATGNVSLDVGVFDGINFNSSLNSNNKENILSLSFNPDNGVSVLSSSGDDSASLILNQDLFKVEGIGQNLGKFALNVNKDLAKIQIDTAETKSSLLINSSGMIASVDDSNLSLTSDELSISVNDADLTLSRNGLDANLYTGLLHVDGLALKLDANVAGHAYMSILDGIDIEDPQGNRVRISSDYVAVYKNGVGSVNMDANTLSLYITDENGENTLFADTNKFEVKTKDKYEISAQAETGGSFSLDTDGNLQFNTRSSNYIAFNDDSSRGLSVGVSDHALALNAEGLGLAHTSSEDSTLQVTPEKVNIKRDKVQVEVNTNGINLDFENLDAGLEVTSSKLALELQALNLTTWQNGVDINFGDDSAGVQVTSDEINAYSGKTYVNLSDTGMILGFNTPGSFTSNIIDDYGYTTSYPSIISAPVRVEAGDAGVKVTSSAGSIVAYGNAGATFLSGNPVPVEMTANLGFAIYGALGGSVEIDIPEDSSGNKVNAYWREIEICDANGNTMKMKVLGTEPYGY